MKRIRFRVIILVCWLVVFSNLERLLEPLFISPFTYSLTLIMVILALSIPRMVHIPFVLFVIAPLPLLLIYKVWIGGLSQNTYLLLIFLEACSISLTTLIACWVNKAIGEFEDSVAHILVGNHDKSPEPYTSGQGLIYREVRRARNHQRPLTLMSITADEKSIKTTLDRMAQEAQHRLVMQYTLSNIAHTLCEKMEDSDIIVQRNDHFIIVLPETGPEHIHGLIHRLRQQISDQVGVELKIGTASLPKDGFTLEGLVEKATSEMQADRPGIPAIVEMDSIPVKHHLS